MQTLDSIGRTRYRHIFWTIAGMYAIVFSFLFLFDEPLNPEVPLFTDFSAEQVPDEQNAYFAFLGFRAAAGADIHAKGIEVIKAAEIARSQHESSVYESDKLLGKPLDLSTGPEKIYDLMKKTESGFLPYARQAREKLSRLSADNKELMGRYYALYRYHYHREPLTLGPYLPIPPYSFIRNANWLFLADLAVKVDQGKSHQALEELSRDMTFWRNTLKDSRMLITRLISISVLRTEYQFLSELIRTVDLRKHGQQIERALAPLTEDELNMARTMRYEFLGAATAMRDIRSLMRSSHNPFDGKWGFVLLPLYKPNATINQTYREFKYAAETAAVPATALKEKLAGHGVQNMITSKMGLDFLYNPIGLITAKISTPFFTSYVTKNHDLEGFRRLVALQFEAKKRNVAMDKMTGFIQTAGQSYANPHTEKPMDWDSQKQCIYFDKLNDSGGARVELCFALPTAVPTDKRTSTSKSAK